MIFVHYETLRSHLHVRGSGLMSGRQPTMGLPRFAGFSLDSRDLERSSRLSAIECICHHTKDIPFRYCIERSTARQLRERPHCTVCSYPYSDERAVEQPRQFQLHGSPQETRFKLQIPIHYFQSPVYFEGPRGPEGSCERNRYNAAEACSQRDVNATN